MEVKGLVGSLCGGRRGGLMKWRLSVAAVVVVVLTIV